MRLGRGVEERRGLVRLGRGVEERRGLVRLGRRVEEEVRRVEEPLLRLDREDGCCRVSEPAAKLLLRDWVCGVRFEMKELV